MNGTAVKQADAAAPGAPPAGRWQFSMLQLLGATTGLALVMGAAAALFQPTSTLVALLYALLAAGGSGVIVGSMIREPLRAILGAITAALPVFAIVYLFDAVASLAFGGSSNAAPHPGTAIAVCLAGIPGAMAAMRSVDRVLHVWALTCATIALLGYLATTVTMAFSASFQGDFFAIAGTWLIGLLLVAVLGYTFALGSAALAWAWGHAGLAMLEVVFPWLARRAESVSRDVARDGDPPTRT